MAAMPQCFQRLFGSHETLVILPFSPSPEVCGLAFGVPTELGVRAKREGEAGVICLPVRKESAVCKK